MGLIPGLGTQILHALRCGKKKKKKNFQCSNEGVVLRIKKLWLNEFKQIGKGHLNSSLPASSAQSLAHCVIWMKDLDLKGTESGNGKGYLGSQKLLSLKAANI